MSHARVVWVLVVLVLVLVTLAGCSQDEPEPLPPFEHDGFYEQMLQNAGDLAYQDGQWYDDYGDAAFYGLAFYARSGVSTGNAGHLAIADEVYARTVTVVQEANFVSGDVNEITMAALGLIEYMAATGDESALADLDAMLDNLDDLVELFGFYLDGGVVTGYAVDTYGPTSISGLVGLLNLQYAYLLDTPEQDRRVEWAAEAVAEIDAAAYNGETYDFGSGRPGLFLYPNVTMILLHVRLYQLTGLEHHLQRAEGIYQAIQALKVDHGPGMVRYRSPYSAEYMGAATDDYSTLSSQNYAMFALLLLYEATGNVAYMREFNAIVEFLSTQIYGDYCRSDLHFAPCDPGCLAAEVCLDGTCLDDTCSEGVLHHWMDGQIAVVADPEFFCSGCNLQLLYVMWYRRHNIIE